MNFLNEEHKVRFEELKRKAGILTDKERLVVMYIFAGNDGLYGKAESLYDFSRGEFIFDRVKEDGKYKIEWKKDLSSSEKRLALLAYDLFADKDNVYVAELFRFLDGTNTKLAFKALEYIYLF